MSKTMSKRMLDHDYREHELHLYRATDAAGHWFTTAMLLALLIAGVIIYRTGNPELRPVTGATTTIAQSNPAATPQRH
jgi:hypothetical protein